MPVERHSITPTITGGAYSDNDVVGGLLTFTGLRGGTLQSILVCDNAAQAVDYLLLLFNAAPTSIADNATFDITDADLAKIIYQHRLYAFPHVNADNKPQRQVFTDNSYSYEYNLDVPLWSEGGTLYGFLITTGGPVPTYAATSDITIVLQVETAHKRAGT